MVSLDETLQNVFGSSSIMKNDKELNLKIVEKHKFVERQFFIETLKNRLIQIIVLMSISFIKNILAKTLRRKLIKKKSFSIDVEVQHKL
jgi:hypothetical protein